MIDEAFFLTVAGVAMSFAGFAGLMNALRRRGALIGSQPPSVESGVVEARDSPETPIGSGNLHGPSTRTRAVVAVITGSSSTTVSIHMRRCASGTPR